MQQVIAAIKLAVIRSENAFVIFNQKTN